MTLGMHQSATASHIAGGDISYECVGKDSFLITVNIFRDCAGITVPQTIPVDFVSTCGQTVATNLVQQSSVEISQLCPSQLPNSSCNSGALPGVLHYVYSGIVVLDPPCNSWKMSWSECCRNASVSNLTSGLRTYLYTTMYSGVDSCNNSPLFTSLPIPYVCKDQVVNYNFGIVEPDGDSIVYFLSPGYVDDGVQVSYVGTYTEFQPFPGANAVLNQNNGQLTFTPTLAGVFVVVVRIEEYDRVTGVIKGTSIRDIQVVVQTCTNLQPVVDSPGIYNFTGTATLVDSNTINMCEGDSFSFDISMSDPDPLNIINLHNNIHLALGSSAKITTVSGNPATIHVSWVAPPGTPPYEAFTVTGIDNACPVVGIISAAFNVNVSPRTYAGPDVSICEGSQWADLQVTGGDNFTWFIISGPPLDTVKTSPNYNMTCWNCANPSVSPKATTTYGVFSDLKGTCYSLDTVTVTVNPNFNLTMPADTIICPIDTISLPASVDEPTFSYTYKWTPSQFMNYDNIINPKVLPKTPTSFVLTVEANGGCVKKDGVFVNLAPTFPTDLGVFGDTVLCLGDTIQLEIILASNSKASCGPSISPCIGNNLSGVIGRGSLSNSAWADPAPYAGSYASAVHQFLFRASELKAMGMTAGKISAISFDNLGIGAVTEYKSFQVEMGCTSSTDLSGGWESGLTTVLPAYTHTTIKGWNKHSFVTEYDWDGISNLVIQVCFTNQYAATNGEASTKFTTTSFQSTRFSKVGSGTACPPPFSSTATSGRPNVKFDFCTGANPKGFTYLWSPAGPTIDSVKSSHPKVSPLTTTTYNVLVKDTFGTCSGMTSHKVSVFTTFDASFNLIDTICYNGGQNTIKPNVGGGILTGTGVVDGQKGIFDPSVANIGTWPIKYTVTSLTGGCGSSFTKNVTVRPLPDATFTPKEFCLGSAPDTLKANTTGGVWGGTGISDTLNGIFRPGSLPAGVYDVTYSLRTPCLSIDTQQIRIIEPYSFTLKTPVVDVCEGSTVNLNNNINLSKNPLQGSGPIVTIWSDPNSLVDASGIFDAAKLAVGDYIVTLGIEGVGGYCGTSQTMTVRVQPIEYTSPSGDLAFCTNNKKARLFISPWLYGAGVTFKQTPIAPLGATDTLNIHSYGQNGEFDATIHGIGKWEFEVTYENRYGCVGVKIDTIYTLDTPKSPVIDPALFCEGDDVILSATGVNQDSIYWHNDYLLKDVRAIGSPQLWGIAPNPGANVYTVWATENNWACVSPRVEYILPIKPSPVADYEMAFTDTAGMNQVNVSYTNTPVYGMTPFIVDFSALNTNSTDTVVWYHNWDQYPDINKTNVNNTNNANVRFNYSIPNLDNTGQLISGKDVYVNQLIVTNQFGCKDTVSGEIYSRSSESLFNVFTPNGDGQNDIFYVPVFGLDDYKVQVFNRWGRLVNEWEDPSIGWDGEGQSDGVYFYVVTGVNQDADRTEYKKQGTVTLMGSGKK